ncbi:MAG: class I SAM-dependent methyltransferase [Acidobacteriales bacterium]|nr:class I SAM-dependent methyltransferase [Terriglobales bacterium]
MNSSEQQRSPERIFNAFNAFQHSAILKTAIELEVFSAIAAGHNQVSTLASQAKASERGIRILCDALTIMELLLKSGNSYQLTPDAEFFLVKGKPSYLGDAARFLLADHIRESYDHLTEAVRQGGTALAGDGTVSTENPVWVDFARGMMPMMMPASQAIAALLAPRLKGAARVLDIAAGHGLFGIMIAKSVPGAQIEALDWKAVLAVATENAQRFGVADRHHTRPGSAFETEFGTGYDAVLLTNFLHHFDEATNIRLLKRVRDALKPGGAAVILEFVPNDDRVTPPSAAWFPVIMLANTPHGDAYTYAELKRMCESAGLAKAELHPAGPSPESIVLAIRE